MRSIRPFTIAISAAALVVMSACGSDTTTPSTAPATSASPSASATVALPTGPATVMVSTTRPVLTDSRGFALYKFDPDDATPGISTCYEVRSCATNWPPLLTKGLPTAGTGATAAMLGTTTRKDGNVQVTYNKMPLYLYKNDTAPGQFNGQAVGNPPVWWLVAADGTVNKETAAPTTSSPTTTS